MGNRFDGVVRGPLPRAMPFGRGIGTHFVELMTAAPASAPTGIRVGRVNMAARGWVGTITGLWRGGSVGRRGAVGMSGHGL